MREIFKGAYNFRTVAYAMLALVAGYFFKVSPIIGSHCSFFSLSDTLAPLAGLGGGWLAVLVMCVKSGITAGVLYLPFKALLYHIPGFLASLAWCYPNKLLRVVLPLGCMVAFMVHPIGMYVIPYTFYWLIPVYLCLANKRGIFSDSLATTFVAHAVGSVIWLYTKDLSVATWWSLIPVVAGERLFNASCMAAFCYGLVAVKERAHTFKRKLLLVVS